MSRTLAVLALVLPLAGCPDKSADKDGSKVTPGSAADATQPVVDQDYKFRLERPGPKWKVLNEADARQLNADALAGAVDDSGRFAIVIAEEMPGVSVEEYGKLVLSAMQLVDRQVERQGATKHKGRDAYQFVVRGKTSGMEFRYGATLVQNGDFLFQLLSWGAAAKVDASELLAVADSFSLLEGKPVGRARKTATVEQADGPGWRVRGGVFESAVSQLRIAPSAGWGVVVGVPLDQMNNHAEVGMSRTGPDVYLVLVTEKAPRDEGARKAQAAKLESDVKTNLGIVGESVPWKARFLGKDAEFALLPSSQLFEYVHGVVYHRDVMLQVLGWYAKPLRDRAQAELSKAFGSVTSLSEAGVAALRVQLELAPSTENVVGPSFALRRGMYRNFERQISWKRPKGLWSVDAGDAAHQINKDAELYIHDKSLGLHALVIAENAGSFTPESYERALVDNLRMTSGFRPGPVTVKGSFAGAPTRLVQGPSTLLAPLHQILATTVFAGHAVQMMIWGHPEDIAEHGDSVEALISGLRFDATLKPTVRTGNRHRDVRMGYSVEIGPDWKDNSIALPNADGVASYTSWTKGGEMVIVLALCALDASQDQKWFQGFMDQMMRDKLGETIKGKPTETQSRLASEPATRVSWSQLGKRADALYAMRDRTLYAVVATGRSSATFDSLVKSFRFED